jgi:hypothetical protein
MVGPWRGTTRNRAACRYARWRDWRLAAREHVIEEGAHERSAVTGGVRATDACGRQRAAHTLNRVVVQLLKLLGRALPVADVGFVPYLPVPLLHLGPPVPLDAVRHPRAHEIGPTHVVLRRIGPSREDRIVSGGGRPRMPVRFRSGRQVPRHEADLRIRPHPAFEVGIEDAIENGPVVDRPARSVLLVGVGRAPLESGRSIARREQIVGAEVHALRRKLSELPEERPPVFHIGVVRLVGAEKAPDGPQRTAWRRGIHTNGDRECGRGRRQFPRRPASRDDERGRDDRQRCQGSSTHPARVPFHGRF